MSAIELKPYEPVKGDVFSVQHKNRRELPGQHFQALANDGYFLVAKQLFDGGRRVGKCRFPSAHNFVLDEWIYRPVSPEILEALNAAADEADGLNQDPKPETEAQRESCTLLGGDDDFSDANYDDDDDDDDDGAD